MVDPTIKIVVENSGVEVGEFEQAQDISFVRILSSVGELVFRIPQDDPKFALLTGMRSHIKLVRNGTVVWKGIYDYLSDDGDNFVIFASTYESLLARYLVAPDAPATSTTRKFTAKKLGTEIVQVLFNEAKALSDSLLASFTLGTIENPYTPSTTSEMTSNFEFDYDSLYAAIRQVQLSGGADFDIDFNKQLNFYRRKGADRTNIVFQVKEGYPSNIKRYKRDVDFRKIGNDLYAFGVGIGANFLKANTTDSSSITTYGRLQKNLGMPKVIVDQAALNKLVDDQIQTSKIPEQLVSPSVVTNGVGFLSGWDLGDNVNVIIDKGQSQVSEMKRVIGLKVDYSRSGAESLSLYLGTKKV